MKRCNGCKQELPYSSFYKTNDHGGFYSRCKKCKSAQTNIRTRRKHLENPEIQREYLRKRYYNNKEIENEKRSNRSKKVVKELHDSYVLKLLVVNTKICKEQIPPILVELKRLELLIKRPIERDGNEKR